MDEIRRRRADIQKTWDGLSSFQRALAGPMVVPMLEELDKLIALLEKEPNGN
jgi:hypothetical protein